MTELDIDRSQKKFGSARAGSSQAWVEPLVWGPANNFAVMRTATIGCKHYRLGFFRFGIFSEEQLISAGWVDYIEQLAPAYKTV
jgi:hypothetical protein